MPPQLRELLLPGLVEQRRQAEQRAADEQQQLQLQQLQLQLQKQTEVDVTAATTTTTTTLYTTANSSSSDVASPVTPTFSTRGHMRFSSSTSSLDTPLVPTDCPSSPTTAAPATTATTAVTAVGVVASPVAAPAPSPAATKPKSQLPDVQEEYTTDEESTILAHARTSGRAARISPSQQSQLQGQSHELQTEAWSRPAPSPPTIPTSPSTTSAAEGDDGGDYDDEYVDDHDDADAAFDSLFMEHREFDYDIGFLSDSDFNEPRQPKRRRAGSASPFVGLADRIGSKIPTLARWKSGRSLRLTPTAPTSPTAAWDRELGHPVYPSMPGSRAASSRSSSLSAGGANVLERFEHVPATPQVPPSYLQSTESINVNAPAPIDIRRANDLFEEEPDRTHSTTPLLPPLLTDSMMPVSQRASPLQSPTVQSPVVQSPAIGPSSPGSEGPSHHYFPSLSAKPSVASFRPPQAASCATNPPDVPVAPTTVVQEQDEWSDRLGHANFTIIPKPYRPDVATMNALYKLRGDWDAARVNYTKHIVRTGDNYGTTGKIYSFTEEKWGEIEQRWRDFHAETMNRIIEASNAHENMPPGQEPLPASSSTTTTANPSHNGSSTNTSSTAATTATASSSRSRSRGRGRARADSGGPLLAQTQTQRGRERGVANDVFADEEWRRLESSNMMMSSAAICRMLDGEGSKFPSRGDEDIVGPMTREPAMVRARSEDRKPRFWKALRDMVRVDGIDKIRGRK